MAVERKPWVLVLAAGEGSRLSSLTTDLQGRSVPKQFCSLRGGSSLLDDALARARSVSVDSHICAVVAAQHRCWWSSQLDQLPDENIIVQSRNCGTAYGILLPLLLLRQRDPGGRILLLPSDHHVRQEAILADSMREALKQLRAYPLEVQLLGLGPEAADPQLGYIVPGRRDPMGRLRVTRFVEKPTATEAQLLMGDGALWNAFVVASTIQSLLALFWRLMPTAFDAMQTALRQDLASGGRACAIARLYERLPTTDFSRDVLTRQIAHLRVLPVPACGWSDLGTPERVARALHDSPSPWSDGPRVSSFPHLNLAAQHERLRNIDVARREAAR